MSKTPTTTKTIEVRITARFPEHGEFEETLERRIHEVIGNEYMKHGSDLMGYDGPRVKRITTTVTNKE